MMSFRRVVDAAAAPVFEALEPRQLASATPLGGRGRLPQVRVADAEVVEGTGGSTSLTFVITRSGTAAQLNRTSVVTFATRDGDDDAALAGEDYTAKTGSVTFKPRQTVKKVKITVNPDSLYEGGANTSEKMRLRLTGATEARLGNNIATGEIKDDDRRPRISVADASVLEGDAGFAVLKFVVRLTSPSQDAVSVDFATANGTATAGVDYIAQNGTLLFSPGQSQLTIDVLVPNNLGSQGHRTFDLVLSNPVGAAISDDRATGTIIDDESTPVLLLNDINVTERDSGTRFRNITVSLSHAGASTAAVEFTTLSGTAKFDTDYLRTRGTLTFAPGVTSATIRVAIIGDTVKEKTESFSILFGNAVNMQLLDTSLAISIQDND